MGDFIGFRSRRFGIEWLALGIVVAVLGGVLSAALIRERVLVGARESDRLQHQARVINENLVRQLEGVNEALIGIRQQLERTAPGTSATITAELLKLLSDAMPGVRTMTVVDAHGVVVASSRAELLGLNSSRRDFFVTPQQRPDRDVLYVATPFKSPLGPLVIVVSRVLTNAQGEFAGIVSATLDPQYFAVLLRSVLYAPDMRASLVHAGGQLFVTMPESERLSGADLAKPGSMFTRHRESNQTAIVLTGPNLIASVDLMMALRTLDRADLHMDKPLVASVAREVSAIYLPWREQTLRFGLGYGALVVASILALHLNQRRRTMLERMAADVTRERQRGSDRLDLALQGADLGLWDLHVPTGDFVTNDRERVILGYSPHDVLPQAGAWRELIHRDDRARVDAAILPHLRCETATYGCEHRMRHKAGHDVWLSSRAMIVERDAQGRPVRIVGTHLDITERRSMDAELAATAALLRRSEEQLRQVTDSLPVLISRWDREQRFVFANRAFRDWLGIDPASLLGRTVREVYGDDAYRLFRHHIDTALGGHRVVYERKMTTPHGVRHVEVTLIPQTDPEGAVQGIYGLVNDLTARHDADLQRARSEERLSLALEGSGLALFDWDFRVDRIYHSAQASAIRGDAAVETTASSAQWRSHVNPDDLPALQANLKAALTGATANYHAEFRIRTISGEWLWVRAKGRVVERDAGGRALRLAGTYADIDARKVAEGQLRRRAEFDALTDLPNRTSFVDRLQQAMARSTAGSSMALLFLDIDHFKTINDTLGHEAGDRLLKVFAMRMQESVREGDFVARLSGDEFTVILEGLRGADDAKAFAGKLVRLLRAPIALGGKPSVVTVSVGIAMPCDDDTDDAELLRRADAALYEAKRRGRDGFFSEDFDAIAGSVPISTEVAAAM